MKKNDNVIFNALNEAIEKNQFHLVYQSQVGLFTQKIRAMEALLRRNHPELGEIQPEKFIPIAERAGLIIPIGE